MPIHPRVICSTISFRHQPLPEALEVIHHLGFSGIDLGALPGVCEHVGPHLAPYEVENVRESLARQQLAVASINADLGDVNRVTDKPTRRHQRQQLERLVRLCQAVGSPALVLPNGSPGSEPLRGLDHDLDTAAQTLTWAADQVQAGGIDLWVEAQHSGRVCWSLDRAVALMARLEGTGIGVVMDFSHVVASGDDPLNFVDALGARVRHVHVRDAVPGDIHLSVGRGDVDFRAGIKALERSGYSGAYSLELETRDVTEDQRPTAAEAAGTFIGELLDSHKETTS